MSSLDIANSNAGMFLQWLLLASASATLIAGVVLIVQKLFSRWTTPAGRQRLWWLVVVRLLLPVLPASAISIANIPVAKLWVKGHREPAPAAITEHRELSKYVTTIRMGPIPASSVPAIQLMPTVQLASEPAHADLTWVLIASIWLVVAVLLLARLIWVNHAMAKRLRSGSEINDPSILNLVRECANAAGLKRAPCIVETTAVGTPAVHGVWKPRILMPVGLMRSLPGSQRRHVILHELSHIRHRDVLANWILAILAICHWFNPLLWLAMLRLKADRELARDAWVIRIGSRSDDEASAYADTLIDLAHAFRSDAHRDANLRLRFPASSAGPPACEGDS